VEIDPIVDAPPPNLRPRFALDRYDALGLMLLAVLVPLVAMPVLRNMIGPNLRDPRLSDYPSHSAYAAQMRHERRLLLPHPLYHLCLLATQKGVEWITGTSAADIDLPAVGHIRTSDPRVLGAVNQAYARAAMTVALAFLLLTAAILWCQARRAVDAANAAAALGCVALVLALMLLGPISLRHAKDGEYYLGYIGISVWHNPTVLVARPLSYLLFLCAAQVFTSKEGPTEQVPRAFAAPLIVLLCAFAKPNYILCLLPALAILTSICLHLHLPLRLRLLIAGIVLPSLAILAWQYYFTFASGAANGITFAPFKVISALARHGHLGQKFALSILFPLACYLIWLPDSLKNVRLNLAGFAFWFAVAFMYLVAEKKNYTDGNFLWGAQIALFILCAESAFFVIAAARRRWATTPSRRWIPIVQSALCATVFALHLYWGIRYRNFVTHTPGGIYP
jgi:hypothetical protein